MIMILIISDKKAKLSQGEPSDAAANFYKYRSLQRHRSVFTAIAQNRIHITNRINHGKITLLSIYFLQIHYVTYILRTVNISDHSKC